MTQEELIIELKELAVRFSEGWHEGIKINASDIMLLNEAAQALAQPKQEPVAWRTFDGEGGYDYRSYEDNESYADDWNKRNPNHKGWVDKLYTRSQRTWLGLTDEQIDACWNKDLWKEKQPHHIFAKAIEAKLKEKNT